MVSLEGGFWGNGDRGLRVFLFRKRLDSGALARAQKSLPVGANFAPQFFLGMVNYKSTFCAKTLDKIFIVQDRQSLSYSRIRYAVRGREVFNGRDLFPDFPFSGGYVPAEKRR